MGVQVRLPRLICAKIMSKQENKTGTKLYSIFALFPSCFTYCGLSQFNIVARCQHFSVGNFIIMSFTAAILYTLVPPADYCNPDLGGGGGEEDSPDSPNIYIIGRRRRI